MATDPAGPPAVPNAIPLWPDGAPGADSASETFEPYLVPHLVETTTPHGAVIVCPGGGYSGRAAHEGDPIAEWLNSLGIASFVCHYRVAPYRHPYPLLDAQRAVRWVRTHGATWHIDPTKIGILGFSAGGHLVSTVGTHFDAGEASAADPVNRASSRPDALILCYPVISFGEWRHHGSMVNLIGEDPDPALRHSLSNEHQVTAETPPTFLWHTADDAGVPVDNSLLFAAALARCRVPFELHVFASGPHGLGLAPQDPHVGAWSRLAGEWLHALGF